MDNDTIEKMQMILSHQEQQIQDLSDMLNFQRKEIAAIQARLDKTQAKLADIEHGKQGEALTPTEQAIRDKPPHY